MFEDADLIHSYSRAEALADGILIDVTETAREAGFRVPVALTNTVWNDCVAWTDEDSARVVHQDEAARLWDVLWMALVAARRQPDASRLTYELLRVRRDDTSPEAAKVRLVLDIGPGDDGQAVITIGFAEDF